ncbi:diphthamide biosynthesis protein 2 [Cystoisospora suis]|uniref:Diphthamide biosynthesis protein 2 n=1 Tax=Cystoisospora suis TaxID=483139 RepID=A0A2C6L162_9APIC|nr:diphthamide biosynthesis protein 2 [Cystoisospora suis]
MSPSPHRPHHSPPSPPPLPLRSSQAASSSSSLCCSPPPPLLLLSGSVESLLRRPSSGGTVGGGGGGMRVPCSLCSSVACSSCACQALPSSAGFVTYPGSSSSHHLPFSSSPQSDSSSSQGTPFPFSSCYPTSKTNEGIGDSSGISPTSSVHATTGDRIPFKRGPSFSSIEASLHPEDDFFELSSLVTILRRNSSWARIAIQIPTEMIGLAPSLSHRLRCMYTATGNQEQQRPTADRKHSQPVLSSTSRRSPDLRYSSSPVEGRKTSCCVEEKTEEEKERNDKGEGGGRAEQQTVHAKIHSDGEGMPGDGKGAVNEVNRGEQGEEEEAKMEESSSQVSQNVSQMRKKMKTQIQQGDVNLGKVSESTEKEHDDFQAAVNDGERTQLCPKMKKSSSFSLSPPLFFFLGDTVHSSCCPDQLAAEHMEPSALIHMGYACLQWPHIPPAYPILYVYTSLPINVCHFSCSLARRLKALRCDALEYLQSMHQGREGGERHTECSSSSPSSHMTITQCTTHRVDLFPSSSSSSSFSSSSSSLVVNSNPTSIGFTMKNEQYFLPSFLSGVGGIGLRLSSRLLREQQELHLQPSSYTHSSPLGRGGGVEGERRLGGGGGEVNKNGNIAEALKELGEKIQSITEKSSYIDSHFSSSSSSGLTLFTSTYKCPGGSVYLKNFASASSSLPYILCYDVRYHYALPCLLQHIANLFLPPSPPSSISTTPPLSSPSSVTPPAPTRMYKHHPRRRDVEGGPHSSFSSQHSQSPTTHKKLEASASFPPSFLPGQGTSLAGGGGLVMTGRSDQDDEGRREDEEEEEQDEKEEEEENSGKSGYRRDRKNGRSSCCSSLFDETETDTSISYSERKRVSSPCSSSFSPCPSPSSSSSLSATSSSFSPFFSSSSPSSRHMNRGRGGRRTQRGGDEDDEDDDDDGREEGGREGRFFLGDWQCTSLCVALAPSACLPSHVNPYDVDLSPDEDKDEMLGVSSTTGQKQDKRDEEEREGGVENRGEEAEQRHGDEGNDAKRRDGRRTRSRHGRRQDGTENASEGAIHSHREFSSVIITVCSSLPNRRHVRGVEEELGKKDGEGQERKQEEEEEERKKQKLWKEHSSSSSVITWVFNLPLAWTPRLVFLPPSNPLTSSAYHQLFLQKEKNKLTRHSDTDFLKSFFSAHPQGSRLYLRCSSYTTVAGRFLFQVYFRSFDRSVGLAPILPVFFSPSRLRLHPSSGSFPQEERGGDTSSCVSSGPSSSSLPLSKHLHSHDADEEEEGMRGEEEGRMEGEGKVQKNNRGSQGEQDKQADLPCLLSKETQREEVYRREGEKRRLPGGRHHVDQSMEEEDEEKMKEKKMMNESKKAFLSLTSPSPPEGCCERRRSVEDVEEENEVRFVSLEELFTGRLRKRVRREEAADEGNKKSNSLGRREFKEDRRDHRVGRGSGSGGGGVGGGSLVGTGHWFSSSSSSCVTILYVGPTVETSPIEGEQEDFPSFSSSSIASLRFMYSSSSYPSAYTFSAALPRPERRKSSPLSSSSSSSPLGVGDGGGLGTRSGLGLPGLRGDEGGGECSYAFEGNETLAGWREYRDVRTKLRPSPLLHRLLLRFGAGGGGGEEEEDEQQQDAAGWCYTRVISYDPTFFTGEAMKERMIRHLQRIQICEQERADCDQDLFDVLSPDDEKTTADEAEEEEEYARQREDEEEEDEQERRDHTTSGTTGTTTSRILFSSSLTQGRRGGDRGNTQSRAGHDDGRSGRNVMSSPSSYGTQAGGGGGGRGGGGVIVQQEEEESNLYGAENVLTHEEKEYFKPSLCLVDEKDRAEILLRKHVTRISPSLETGECVALLLLGIPVYGQLRVLDFVQNKLKEGSEEENRHEDDDDDDGERKREKRHVTRIAMGEVTDAKLLNFDEVDTACLFGCIELCLRVQLDQKERGITQNLLLPIDCLSYLDSKHFSCGGGTFLHIEYDELSQSIRDVQHSVCLRSSGAGVHTPPAGHHHPAFKTEGNTSQRGTDETSRAPGDLRTEGEGGRRLLCHEENEDSSSFENRSHKTKREYPVETSSSSQTNFAADEWKVALRGGGVSDAIIQSVLGQNILKTNAQRRFKGARFREEEEDEEDLMAKSGRGRKGGNEKRSSSFVPSSGIGDRNAILHGLAGVASCYEKEIGEKGTETDKKTFMSSGGEEREMETVGETRKGVSPLTTASHITHELGATTRQWDGDIDFSSSSS